DRGPATLRLGRGAEVGSRMLARRERRAEGVPSEELEGAEEAPALGRRAVSIARAHPVATAWVVLVVVAAFAYRHLYGGGQLQGGALAMPPGHPSDYFREILSSVRTTALGG